MLHEFQERHGEGRVHEALKSSMLRAKEAISEQTGRRRKLEAFMRELRENDFLTAFDERMFLGTTEKITVSKGQRKSEKQLVFRFKMEWRSQ